MPKYDEYPEVTTLADDDVFLILASGITKRIKVSNARTYFQATPLISGNFNWISNGDSNGIIYAIGSNNNNIPFSNPHSSGKIIAFMSTVASGNATNLTDRTLQANYTTNVANSWIKVDLRTQKLIPNRYTFRHDANTGYYARSWRFEGSNDDNTWITINTQTNNTSINTAGAWASIPVSGSTAYRYFRLTMTAANTSNTNEFCCSEIELYGVLS